MPAIASITPSEPALPARPRLAQNARPVVTSAEPQPGRALVLVGPAQGTAAGSAASRPSAAFLAQLIATAQRAPQTRRRRRADPRVVSTIYTAASAPAARMGGAFCRSL